MIGDAQQIAIFQLSAVDPLVVDKRAVGTAQVFNNYLIFFHKNSAVLLRDVGRAHDDVAIRRTTYDRLVVLDWNFLAALPGYEPRQGSSRLGREPRQGLGHGRR